MMPVLFFVSYLLLGLHGKVQSTQTLKEVRQKHYLVSFLCQTNFKEIEYLYIS
jgi:hypothetical protein